MPAQPHNKSISAAEWKAMNKPSERDLQENIVEWARHQPFPASLLFAVPNGQMRPGVPMEPGLTAGIPDLCLPAPRKVTCDQTGEKETSGALYLELKVGSNQTTERQTRLIKRLRRAGNVVRVVRDFGAATTLINDYLNGEATINRTDTEV